MTMSVEHLCNNITIDRHAQQCIVGRRKAGSLTVAWPTATDHRLHGMLFHLENFSRGKGRGIRGHLLPGYFWNWGFVKPFLVGFQYVYVGVNFLKCWYGSLSRPRQPLASAVAAMNTICDAIMLTHYFLLWNVKIEEYLSRSRHFELHTLFRLISRHNSKKAKGMTRENAPLMKAQDCTHHTHNRKRMFGNWLGRL